MTLLHPRRLDRPHPDERSREVMRKTVEFGKGVAAAGGMTVWLGQILMAVWAVTTLVAKRASVASLLLAVLLVPGLVLFGQRDWSLLWASAAVVLVMYRHRGNVMRLLRGSEHSIEGTAA